MYMERQNGFTLVELLITIVVVSVLLATAIPSFMQFIKNNRVTGQANSFVVSIHVARMKRSNEAPAPPCAPPTRTWMAAQTTMTGPAAGSFSRTWIVTAS